MTLFTPTPNHLFPRVRVKDAVRLAAYITVLRCAPSRQQLHHSLETLLRTNPQLSEEQLSRSLHAVFTLIDRSTPEAPPQLTAQLYYAHLLLLALSGALHLDTQHPTHHDVIVELLALSAHAHVRGFQSSAIAPLEA